MASPTAGSHWAGAPRSHSREGGADVAYDPGRVIACCAEPGNPPSAGADAPASGVVVEGQSVPGVDLGDTRAEVESGWGPPDRCIDIEIGGDQAHCSFPVEGGGSISGEFRGSDGRYARNAPDDVVFEISWGNTQFYTGAIFGQLIDWTTTAGVNTALGLADMRDVAAAYPNAEVTYDAAGNIVRVEDAQLGIRINWGYDGYTHTTGVRIYIYFPRVTAPPGEMVMTVTELELSATKLRGERHILAVLRVQDDRGLPVPGARVDISWTNPRGTTWTINRDVNRTSETGYEFFEISDAQQGTWTFTVNDIVLDGYQFDRGGSLLSAGIRVK